MFVNKKIIENTGLMAQKIDESKFSYHLRKREARLNLVEKLLEFTFDKRISEIAREDILNLRYKHFNIELDGTSLKPSILSILYSNYSRFKPENNTDNLIFFILQDLGIAQKFGITNADVENASSIRKYPIKFPVAPENNSKDNKYDQTIADISAKPPIERTDKERTQFSLHVLRMKRQAQQTPASPRNDAPQAQAIKS